MQIPRRVVTFGQVRTLKVVVTFLTITTLIFMLRLYRRPPSIYQYTEGRTAPWGWWNETEKNQHPDEELYLYYLVKEYGLTREMPWFSRRIKTSSNAWSRQSVTDVKNRFLTHDFTVARVNDQSLKLTTDKPVNLRVHRSPRPEEIDASPLLVGISTTYSRVLHSDFAMIRDWQRWLTDGNGRSNGATLILALHRSNEGEAHHIASDLVAAGIDAVVIPVEEDMEPAERYENLIKRMMAQRSRQEGHEKKYLALVDDDMFFPSVGLLLRRLAKFSPSKEFYIGAPSERLDWTTVNRTMFTYGGGAVFLTPPMAKKLAGIDCTGQDGFRMDDSTLAQWDYALYRCITTKTNLNLQVLPSFYNPLGEEWLGDQGAALNEGYGGGVQPLTLHNYRSFHRFEAGQGHAITSICGEECFLQRFRFTDNWILVAGYTISHYPDGVGAIPLKQSSKLMSQFYGRAWHMAVGKRLVIDAGDKQTDAKVVHWSGLKQTWRLVDSSVRENGEIWQAYVKRKTGENSFSDIDDRLEWGEGEERSDQDSLIILIWEP